MKFANNIMSERCHRLFFKRLGTHRLLMQLVEQGCRIWKRIQLYFSIRNSKFSSTNFRSFLYHCFILDIQYDIRKFFSQCSFTYHTWHNVCTQNNLFSLTLIKYKQTVAECKINLDDKE